MSFAAQADLPNLILRLTTQFINLVRLDLKARNTLDKVLNAELTRKALEKVGNPNVLVNLISRRVRQLNSGAGALSRPAGRRHRQPGRRRHRAARDYRGEKWASKCPRLTELTRPTGKKRKKH